MVLYTKHNMVYQHTEDGPNFQWPETPHEDPKVGSTATDSTANQVVNSVKNIILTLAENKTEPTFQISTEATIQETINSNITTMGTEVSEILNNNNNIIKSTVTEMINSNNTGIQEMFESNNTAINFGDVEGSGDITESVVTTVRATTEKVIDVVTQTFNVETTTEGECTDFEDYGAVEEKTLYIVVGVILAAMILMIIILLIIYKRYKSQNVFRTGAYCVSDLNEVSGCSKEEQHIHNYT